MVLLLEIHTHDLLPQHLRPSYHKRCTPVTTRHVKIQTKIRWRKLVQAYSSLSTRWTYVGKFFGQFELPFFLAFAFGLSFSGGFTCRIRFFFCSTFPVYKKKMGGNCKKQRVWAALIRYLQLWIRLVQNPSGLGYQQLLRRNMTRAKPKRLKISARSQRCDIAWKYEI